MGDNHYYKCLYQHIHYTLNGNLTPNTIMLNFEIEAIYTFKKAFTDIKMCGSHFCFEQYIWRHIQYVVYQNNTKNSSLENGRHNIMTPLSE